MEQLSSSAVSIQDFEEEISGSNPQRIGRRMNSYTFNIFTNHYIAVEDIDEADRIGFYLQHLEIGPLKLPEPSHWNIFKEGIWNISSLVIPSDGGQDSHHGKITLFFGKQELKYQYTQ